MSANPNRFGPAQRVPIVVGGPSVSTTLGRPVGFWASGSTHARCESTEAGYETVVASPAGGKVALDALNDGRRLMAGRHVAGFVDGEEDFADRVVGQKGMPYRIEDEGRRAGADFVAAPALRPHSVRDGQLITGQQEYSGRLAALRVIGALDWCA